MTPFVDAPKQRLLEAAIVVALAIAIAITNVWFEEVY